MTSARATRGRDLVGAVARGELILAEGAVIERLRRDGVGLDVDVANAALVYEPRGRAALRAIWRGYLDVARAAGLPALLCAPTWRASPERLRRAGLPPAARVCADAVRLVREVGGEDAPALPPVFVAGLMSCRGDAYRASEALDAASAEVFHREQAAALAGAGVDLVLAATLPAADEALGLARAIAAAEVPYVIGFVLRPDGTLLDGVPLADVVANIDDGVRPRPIGYAGTCVHPQHFVGALDAAAAPGTAARFVALQGNGSRLSPEELDGRGELDADDPDAFAAWMALARRRFGIGILGGCCGTDERHLAAVAAAVTAPAP